MRRKLKVGIAGYGVVGERRHKYIQLHPDLEVVAVCDQKFLSSKKSEDGIKYYNKHQSLLSEGLDILFVCMPNDIASKVTISGLESGANVFCEKPPGRTVKDILRVMEVEKKNPSLKLKYGFNHRYHDSVREALSLIRSGELGSVINMRGLYGKSKFISFGKQSDWRVSREIAGGGILLDQGIHMVDLMRLFGGEFNEVHSFISNSFWNHDVEDNAYVLMRSDQGVVAMLHSTATQWRHRFSLDITLQKGAVSLAGILTGSKSYGMETMTVIWANDDDMGDPKEEIYNYEIDSSWADEINEFVESIIAKKPINDGTSSDALSTMRLVEKIYCSDEEWLKKWGLTLTNF
jgi:predicted dehydrogenase